MECATLRRIRLRTQPPELGLTLLWWLSDDLEHYLNLHPNHFIEIKTGPALDIKKQAEGLIISAPETWPLLGPNKLKETVRKIGVRLRLLHDATSIDYNRVLNHISKLNEKMRPFLTSNPVFKNRFLLRLDDFPSPHVPSAAFKECHAILKSFDIPYLLAVTPFMRRENISNLTDSEILILKAISAEGTDIALHGFTHERRTPSLSSELSGMPAAELQEKIARSKEIFHQIKIQPAVFVAPFNSYDPSTLAILCSEFPILCGGPESVTSIGYRIPSFLGASFYMPSYRFTYDLRMNDLQRIDSFAKQERGALISITLHWANELHDKFRTLTALCQKIHRQTISWKELQNRCRMMMDSAKISQGDHSA